MLVLICHEVRVPCPPCDYLIQAGPHFRGFKSPRVIGTYQARTSNINIINNSGPVSVARYLVCANSNINICPETKF